MSHETDLEVCRATLAEHSKSFALAARLLPRRQQDDAAAVYAWCRRADDAIDLCPPEDRPGALERLREELDLTLGAARPLDDPILRAFREVAARLPIPRHYPDELLAGMEMDCTLAVYPDDEALLEYCWRVAGTVGLMMAHVLGVNDPAALRRAAHLGMAMQLTNICRDVAEDWERGRLYLPRTRLARHGAGDLEQRLGGPPPRDPAARAAVAAVVEELLVEADHFYRSGDAGLRALPLSCAPSIRVARLVYAAIGTRLRRRGGDALAGRTVVPARSKVRLALAGLGREAVELPRRLAAGRATAVERLPEVRFPVDVLPVALEGEVRS